MPFEIYNDIDFGRFARWLPKYREADWEIAMDKIWDLKWGLEQVAARAKALEYLKPDCA